MKLPEKVKAVLDRRLPACGNIGVAVSGGSDSMCLLDCLTRFGLIDRERIIVIHAEHGIRGEESYRDSSFVWEYCRERGLRCCRRSADIPALAKANGRSVETEARLFRKRIFDDAVNAGDVRAVLLAHNACDRTESVLMHIFRGSGLKGLVGMTECDGTLIRPLLGCEKAEITAYLEAYRVPYMEDSTNADDAYSRNFLRLNVLPLLRGKYPGLDRAVAGLSDAAAQTLGDGLSAYETEGDSAVLDAGRLTGNAVVGAFCAVGLTADYTRKHIDAVLGLARRETGSGADLPHGYRAERESDGIRIFPKRTVGAVELPFAAGEFAAAGRTVVVEKTAAVPDGNATVLDADKLPAGAVIRTRREGDVFRPYGGRTKSLSDWLIDKKIPRYKRERLLYVAAGGEVYAVIGVSTGEKVKLDQNTENAVVITVREGGKS